MTVKICLLVTDDPDDHLAFSEAVAEISEKAIVLIVLDSEKALELLKEKKHAADYIFLDVSMNGLRINTFLKVIKSDTTLQSVPTVVYGEESSLSKVEHYENLIFFNKEYEYSELRDFLMKFFKSSSI